jgi:hypothetical protein
MEMKIVLWVTRFKFACLVALNILTTYSIAQASVVLSPSFSYSTQKTIDSTGIGVDDVDQRVMTTDIRFGRLFESGLYTGGTFRLENTIYGTGSMSGHAIGAAIGYVYGPLISIVHFFFTAERSYIRSNSESKLGFGNGIQLDLGYLPQIADSLGFGPQISFRSISYAKSRSNTNPDALNPFTETQITPTLAFWYSF